MTQELLNEMVSKMRELRFADTPQITLGELIKQIEEAGTQNTDGTDKYMCFDFGYMRPSTWGSWRGSYSELAIGYTEEGDYNSPTAAKFLQDCKDCINKVFQGYKGGDFTMKESTPIWVANYGNSSETGIIGVLDCGYKIVILTAHCEY